MLPGLILLLAALSQSIEGNPRSKVRIIVYEDLQCADCAAFRQMMDDFLLPKYGSLVAFEHRDFPLPKHDWARSAAIAARHFEKVRPEAAVEFRRFIYTRIKQTPVEGFEERVREFARDQGLDPSEAVSALRSRELDALVEKDYEEGVARGVSKVPTIYIEDRAFIEKFRRTDVAAAIDKALAK